jgi:hypothetical protein
MDEISIPLFKQFFEGEIEVCFDWSRFAKSGGSVRLEIVMGNRALRALYHHGFSHRLPKLRCLTARRCETIFFRRNTACYSRTGHATASQNRASRAGVFEVQGTDSADRPRISCWQRPLSNNGWQPSACCACIGQSRFHPLGLCRVWSAGSQCAAGLDPLAITVGVGFAEITKSRVEQRLHPAERQT